MVLQLSSSILERLLPFPNASLVEPSSFALVGAEILPARFFPLGQVVRSH